MTQFEEIEERLHKLLGTTEDIRVSKALGYNTPSAYYAIKQRKSIPYEKLLKFCMEHGIDSISLIYGDRSGKEIIPRKALKNYNEDMYHIFPYFSDARAINSNHNFLMLLPKNRYNIPKGNIEAIKTFNDTMYPLIKYNQVVLFKKVEKTTNIKSSCIYLYKYEKELTIRILIPNLNNPKKVKVISLNTAYPIQDIDFKKVEIIGEFISVI